MSDLRVRWIYDDDPDTSWLEQDEWADTKPDDLVFLACLVDKLCPCCQQWDEGVESLWGISLLASESYFVGSCDVAMASALAGYQGQVSGELVNEALSRNLHRPPVTA